MAKVIYYDFTPSSTSGLAADDVIFIPTTIVSTGAGWLDSIVAYNLDDLDRGIQLLFFDESAAIGAANAAFAPTDANLLKCIASVTFSSGSWTDATNGLIQFKDSRDAGMGGWVGNASPSTDATIYAGGVVLSTGGWSSGGLSFKIGIRQD